MLGEEPLTKGDSRRIVWTGDTTNEVFMDSFDTLSRRIEEASRAKTNGIPLNQVTVLVDWINLSALDVVSTGGGWDGLIAMLILNFPEVRWVFGVITGLDKSGSEEEGRIIAGHSLSSLLKPRRDPLFDPTGLRDWIRKKTNLQLENLGNDPYLPTRGCARTESPLGACRT